MVNSKITKGIVKVYRINFITRKSLGEVTDRKNSFEFIYL